MDQLFNKYSSKLPSKSIGNYIVTEQRLGRGSSATVYLGYHRKKRYKVAVKKFEVQPNNERIRRKADREVRILRLVNHPNIIKFYDVIHEKTTKDIHLFLEYCPNGSLRTFLGKGGYLDEHQAQKIIRQLAKALQHLYRHNIYHRDIKPHNLLLSRKFNLKISDFGLATMNMHGTSRKLCGSPMYMAPEILEFGTYHQTSDLWSVGILLFETLFGHHPLRGIKNLFSLSKHVTSKLAIQIPPVTKPYAVDPTSECIDLVRRLLTADVSNRISWEGFFTHPWIAGPPLPSPTVQLRTKINGNLKKVKEIGSKSEGYVEAESDSLTNPAVVQSIGVIAPQPLTRMLRKSAFITSNKQSMHTPMTASPSNYTFGLALQKDSDLLSMSYPAATSEIDGLSPNLRFNNTETLTTKSQEITPYNDRAATPRHRYTFPKRKKIRRPSLDVFDELKNQSETGGSLFVFKRSLTPGDIVTESSQGSSLTPDNSDEKDDSPEENTDTLPRLKFPPRHFGKPPSHKKLDMQMFRLPPKNKSVHTNAPVEQVKPVSQKPVIEIEIESPKEPKKKKRSFWWCCGHRD